MQPIAVTSQATRAPRPVPVQPELRPGDSSRAGGGVLGFIGDLIRGAGAGYAAATHQTSVQADKALIHPFEAVTTATSLIKSSTAGVPVVSKVTGALHTIGGFALLIGTANVSSSLRSPGDTGSDLAHHIADLIDGKSTAKGWSLGWGIETDPETGEERIASSGLAAAIENA